MNQDLMTKDINLMAIYNFRIKFVNNLSFIYY